MWGWLCRADNKLGAEGARALEPALREMKELRHLDLRCEWSVMGGVECEGRGREVGCEVDGGWRMGWMGVLGKMSECSEGS